MQRSQHVWYHLVLLSSCWLLTLLFLAVIAHARLIVDSRLNLSEIAYHDEPSLIFLGSPSLLRLPSRRLLASHDYFGSGYSSSLPRTTQVFYSDNEGVDWQLLSIINGSYWATLALYDGAVLSIGTDSDYGGRLVLHRSLDFAVTWTSSVVLDARSFATGPTPIVIANDMLFRAVELWPSPYVWPQGFAATIVSLNVTGMHGDDARIMQASSWKVAAPLSFNRSWLPASWPALTAPGYLEGNAVILPPAAASSTASLNSVPRVLNVLRFNSDPLANLAVILELDLATNTQHFLSFITLPGAMSKFTIRYHPRLKAYVTLSNPVPTASKTTYQRNVLHWFWCEDLTGLSAWNDGGAVAWDDTGLDAADSIKYTGFQYVDWQFDTPKNTGDGSCIQYDCDGGDDIIAAIRTSYRGANSYHNSNRLTFKLLSNITGAITHTSQRRAVVDVA